MSRKILLIHVGTHKTGTTSFQSLMLNEPELFLRSGVYPCTGESRDGHNIEFSHSIIRPNLITGARARKEIGTLNLINFLRYTLKMRREFKTKKEAKTLISAESLCFARTPRELLRVKLFCALTGYSPVPIIVFRNKEDWKASWENQVIKSEDTRHLLNEGKIEYLHDWYYDKSAIRKFWSKIGNTIEIDYDREVSNSGTIVASLLTATGVTGTPVKDYKLNIRQ